MGSILGVKGRYNRLQWWMTQLAIGLVFAVTMFLLLGSIDVDAIEQQSLNGSTIASLFVVFIILAWINISSCIKRYHDRGKSGWWFFITLVPVIGPIWQLVELGFLSGDDGYNQFDVDDSFDPAMPIPRQYAPRSATMETPLPAPTKQTDGPAGRPSFGQKPGFGRRA